MHKQSASANVFTIVTLLCRTIVALLTRAAVPLTGGMVLLKRLAPEGGYPFVVEDALTLAPFFFGLACMHSLHAGRRRTHSDAFSGGIYYLCL